VASSVPTYGFAVNPPWEWLPRVSAVVRAGLAGDYHTAPFTTTLSLKSVSRGIATWSTPRSRYRVDPHGLVVLNQGQTYKLDIDGEDRAGTLALFFEPGLVEDVARALSERPDAFLDGRNDRPPSFEIHERVHPKTGEVAARLAALEDGLSSQARDAAWIEEQMLALAIEIVRLEGRARQELTTFPGLRASTRAEAYRRLHWARDYIDASFAEPLTIARLARVACMSPFHFQRLFKESFGETPMQRVQRRRIEEAARLLVQSDRDVTRICLAVGFESLGTFSWLFRRRMGVSPRRYRQTSTIEEVRTARRI
jgi:AraC family transcriptional regulator